MLPLRLGLVAVLAALRLPAIQASVATEGFAQDCNPDAAEEDCSVHTSLLQTSVKLDVVAADVVAAPRKAHRQFVARASSIVTARQRRHRRANRFHKLHQHAKALGLHHAVVLTSAHGSREDAQNHTIVFLLVAIAVLAVVAFAASRWLRAEDFTTPRSFEDHPGVSPPIEGAAQLTDLEDRAVCGFDEDVYMLGLVLLVRELQGFAKGTANFKLKSLRISYAFILLFGTLGMQILLLGATKAYVTPQAVASIRDSYDQYEIQMYGGEENTRVLYTGKHRGQPQYFDASRFDDLDDDLKSDVCQIPFSQLKFLVLVLLIWSITCVSQLNRGMSYIWNLLVMLPTISSMEDAVETTNEGKPRTKRTIVGLTLPVKIVMLFSVFLPWLASTCYLCWLGCRWLAATNSFGDFIANGMALEFILQFKSLVYCGVVSDRTKRDLQDTRHLPPYKREAASYLAYYNTILWGMLAVAWTYLYIFHFQRVLPEYQWDVHAPCTPYLQGVLRPSAGDD